MVPAAIGSDGAGSVRIPAAWTHLVGIKPQRGRISTWPEPESFHGITVNGPLARTVADAALLFDVVAGNHNGDPAQATAGHGARRGRPRSRPAADRAVASHPVHRHPHCVAPGDPDRGGPHRAHSAPARHDVVVDDPEYGILLGLNFLPRSLAGIEVWLDRLPDRSLVDPRTPRQRRNRAPALRVAVARRAGREPRMRRRIGAIFDDYDVVLAPTTATPPRASTRWTVSAVSLPTR